MDKRREYQREYYQKNKDKRREYEQKNKDKRREYHQKNKDKRREYQREYHQKNKDKIREYEQKNKDKRREYEQKNKDKRREYYQKNKDKIREYHQKNPEIRLKANKRLITKLARKCKVTIEVYMYALMAWSKNIKKIYPVCQYCGSNHELNSHHIIHKAKYPELSLNVNNGITLCSQCHYEVHGKNVINQQFYPKIR